MLLILLYFLWILFNGRVTAEILIIGVPVAGLVWFLSLKMFSLSPRADFHRLRLVPRGLGYLFYLGWQVVSSALHVALLVWTPGQPDSVIADFDSGLRTSAGQILLADSITLTPGTITLDSADGHFRVHCLEKSSVQDLSSGDMLKKVQKLEGAS